MSHVKTKLRRCERCNGTRNVQFTGQQRSYPDPIDARNTKENLPYGKSFLCEECLDAYYTDVVVPQIKLQSSLLEAYNEQYNADKAYYERGLLTEKEFYLLHAFQAYI